MRTFKFLVLAAAAVTVPAAAHAKAYIQVQSGLDSLSVSGSSEEDLAYGIAAGYELPISENWFLGLEGSYDDSDVKRCVGDIFELGDRGCVKTGRDLSLVARIGTGIGANGQIYLLGGYTNARFKVVYSEGIDEIDDGSSSDGFRLGAGYKHNFSDHVFGKLEYRYSNYDGDISRHNALLAVGYEF